MTVIRNKLIPTHFTLIIHKTRDSSILVFNVNQQLLHVPVNECTLKIEIKNIHLIDFFKTIIHKKIWKAYDKSCTTSLSGFLVTGIQNLFLFT